MQRPKNPEPTSFESNEWDDLDNMVVSTPSKDGVFSHSKIEKSNKNSPSQSENVLNNCPACGLMSFPKHAPHK